MAELNRPDTLPSMLADLERRLHALETVSQLDNATLHGTIIVGPDLNGKPGRIQTPDFDGSDFAHPGTAGNYFGKDGAVLNALYLRPGSVSNDKLANPVVPQVLLQQVTNYAVGAGSLATIVSQSVTVPAGCTQLLANVTAFSFVVNPNTTGGSNGAGGDIHELKAYIGGSGGQTTGVSISGSNGQTSVTAGAAVLLSGLTPGNTVLLEAKAGNGFQAFAANGSNVASITATLLWLR